MVTTKETSSAQPHEAQDKKREKPFILNTIITKEKKRKKRMKEVSKNRNKRVRLWQFHPAPLFPKSPRKRMLPTQGRFGWQDQKQRTQGKGACYVLFCIGSSLPFEYNDVMAIPLSLVTLYKKYRKTLSCWQVKNKQK